MVGTALVSMYGRCGCVDAATAAFRAMLVRNLVSWNAVIAANAQNGHGASAVLLFREMSLEGVKPNSVTLASALEGCAFAGALQQGRTIHTLMVGGAAPLTSESGVVLWTSLLNMYAKCGTVNDAEGIFHSMACRNIITWNTLLAAYAQRGHVCEVVDTFALMQQEGIGANPITFVNVLYAFSHAGLLEPAVKCFGSMLPEYGIQPDVEHFGCLVDLMGRAGWLNEAEDVIKLMPLKDDAVWLALLNGCKMHHDSQRGAQAAGKVFNMELKDSAPYVLLSSIHSRGRSPSQSPSGVAVALARDKVTWHWRALLLPTGRSVPARNLNFLLSRHR
ncbi:pentatricopeptide repeat-containing protein ELI1, chloroplastic-like [Selaginella moellendorffii]|uniref:pentatricopeptide repeat-containing protein ELI1, chloroplastic-like n=1 Tax=Selaginella moellendorffii TaxID=88036 RepID=UPI000D1CC605|nr:pentatricopeptide repeat-containing protein ELI1, chloroplastic-like [Selaginella moellendorffii]|eukprot:XP_024529405.1 pentatricopeptide repeat-containing protein ELI1, chloroplastic-like [Selaginella moellendorffii]